MVQWIFSWGFWTDSGNMKVKFSGFDGNFVTFDGSFGKFRGKICRLFCRVFLWIFDHFLRVLLRIYQARGQLKVWIDPTKYSLNFGNVSELIASSSGRNLKDALIKYPENIHPKLLQFSKIPTPPMESPGAPFKPHPYLMI